jgi:glycosyltransferase involved in cell wall biosynthesis
MHEVAAASVRRGMRAIVFAADSGYDDPTQRYPRYECCDGVHVFRLPWSSFGKRSLVTRLIGGSVFTSEAALLALTLPRIDHVLVSTSPPMCALAGLTISHLRGTPLSFWAMDINPDQIVSTGRLAADALPVRAFEWMNRRTLARAHNVVALDAFMAERLRAKSEPLQNAVHTLHVLPPWPLFAPATCTPNSGQRFRQQHGFGDRRVVMYSGNLSPVHPIDTLLRAVDALRDDPRLLFVFIGGGLERETIAHHVREHALPNVLLLPYQPLELLPESLAAADLHLVAMGDAMVGIVHPSKIYSAMSVGRPILALGPRRSHIAEIVHKHQLGWHVEHGDVAGAVHALQAFAHCDAHSLAAIGERARLAVDENYGKSQLLDQFCDWLVAPADGGPAHPKRSRCS